MVRNSARCRGASVVCVLSDMWFSWGPEICTALAATEEINAESAENDMTYCYVVQQLGGQRWLSGFGYISTGLGHSMMSIVNSAGFGVHVEKEFWRCCQHNPTLPPVVRA